MVQTSGESSHHHRPLRRSLCSVALLTLALVLFAMFHYVPQQTSSLSYRSIPNRSHTPTDSRVAVCITGGVRTLPVVLPRLKLNLLKALQPDPSRLAVFLELGRVSDCKSNSNNKPVLSQCLASFEHARHWLGDGSRIARELSRDTAGHVELHIEDELNCTHPFARLNPCCRRNPDALTEGRGISGMAQFTRRSLCLTRVQQHVHRSGTRFDLLLWVRPDVDFFHPVPSATYFLRLQPRIWMMPKESSDWADYLYMAPLSHVNVLEEVFRTSCEGDPGRSPEYKIAASMRDTMVFQIWPFFAAVVRSNRTADCGRLSNDVLVSRLLVRGINSSSTESARGVNSSVSTTISPVDVCRMYYPVNKDYELYIGR